ncbi:hypothetical protein ACI8B_610021 [Acinetobacter proteolyticus]|uniref:Uncharacterized protein n=1 Tax=Acinetobacter proteolyticus TaxID=1776741 RepID=A0A653KCT6_9GAMM|nr:hypothetical protein ACI8B_610021 [Acinetobacter proteolyticus]
MNADRILKIGMCVDEFFYQIKKDINFSRFFIVTMKMNEFNNPLIC